MQPPINDIDDYWLPHEKAHAEQMLACSIIGGPETVRKGLEAFVERTQADELMIVSDMYEPSARLKSLEIIADVMGAKAKTPA